MARFLLAYKGGKLTRSERSCCIWSGRVGSPIESWVWQRGKARTQSGKPESLGCPTPGKVGFIAQGWGPTATIRSLSGSRNGT